MPVTISATRTTSLFTDQDSDGRVDQGDTLFIRLDIANSGDVDALNVVVNDALLGQSLVAGSLNISPVAFNDSFNAVGNTQLLVGGATGLSGPTASFNGNILSNDLGALAGDNFTGFTLTTTGNLTSSGNGSVVLNADGSFSYNPAVGFTGADTFTYTIRDAGQDGVAGNSDDLSSTAKVTINVANTVWYVDTTAATNGDGTSDNPFNTIANVNGAGGVGDVDAANHTIYLKGSATASLGLEAGQQLIGAGAALVVGGFTLATAGTNSTLNASSGSALTLASGNTLAGVGITGTGGITGNNFGTFTVNGATLNTSGQALNLVTGAVAGTGFTSTSSTGGTNNVNLDGVTGTVNLGGGALSGATGNAFDVNGGNGSVDYNGSITHTANARAIDITNKTGGTVSFDGTVSSTASSDGINLDNNDTATINFSQALTLTGTGAGTVGFTAINGGTVSATGSGSTINSGNATALNVANTFIGLGGLNFVSIASNGAANGIILNNTGTTAGVHGGLTVIGTGTNDSGGVIQNSTGDAILLVSTRNVSLTQMRLFNSTDNNLDATSVTNLTLDSVTFNQSGTTNFLGNGLTALAMTGSSFDNSGNAAAEHGVFITNLFGNSSVTSTDFHRSGEVQFKVSNTTATVAQGGVAGDILTMSGVTFADHTSATFGDSIQINADQLANLHFILNNSVGANSIAGGIDGILVNASSGGDADVDISNVAISGTSGPGINFNPVGTGSRVWFFVNNNTITGPGSTGINATAIGNDAQIQGFINNNTITQGAVGNGITIITEGDGDNTSRPTATISATGNTITGVQNGSGINAQARVGGALNLTLDNNHVNINNNLNLEGIRVTAGSSSPADNIAGLFNIVRLNMLNNDVTVGALSGQEDYAIQVRGVSLFELQNFTGNGNGTDTVDESNWIIVTKDNNKFDGVTNPVVQIQHTSGGVFTASAGNIPTPVLPTPLLFAPFAYSAGAAVAHGAEPAHATVAGVGRFAGMWIERGVLMSPWLMDVDRMEARLTGPVPQQAAAPSQSGGTDAARLAPMGPSPISDDGILTQSELNWLVEAAIRRWAEAGASAEQIAAMRATTISAENLGGLTLGKSAPGAIVLDDNAAGNNWYLDMTPGADEEYGLVNGVLRAGDTTVAGTRVDLLTTLMHELGHQIGLVDEYGADDAGGLMYGFVNPGIRRLPGAADAHAAEGAPVFGAFALGAVGLGTLGAGVTASLSWRTTYDGVTNQVITNVANNSVVSGSNFGAVNSTTNTLGPATAPPVDVLTLGDRVFFDANRNGVFDAGDSGVNGVTLSLFADANNDNIADGAAIATTTTAGAGAAAGTYSFTNLAAGNYIIRVDAGNFTVGPLVGRVSTINAGDPDIGDPDADNDSNGGVITGGVVNSQAITLAFDTEPTGGAGNDTNNTLDFGFIAPNQAPTSGNLSGDIATYTEQQALAALLDVGSNAGVADADSANFDGGTLTVAITGGLVAAQDQLVIRLTGTVSFNATAVFVNGTQIATYTGAGAGGGPLVFTFDPDATPAAVAELVRAIAYTNSAGDTPTAGARTISWTLVDGDGTFGGGSDTLAFTSSVNVVAVDDTGVAGADSGALADNATTVLTVLANDSDVDGPPPSVAQVNGTAIAIGGSVTLASGAKVTRNADGTLTYDTNGAFEALPTAGSGASNPISATDSFTYTLAGGGTATVTMTINGIDNNDTLQGTGGDDILFGGVGNDIINALGGNDRLYGGTGTDTMTGGGGDDIYIVDNAGDVLVEGAGGGLDSVFTSVNWTLAAEFERLGVSDFGTTNAIDLTGNGVANEMWGNAGANVLDGKAGADIMSGFAGDDTYYVDNAGEAVIELLNEGTDTVLTSVSYTIAHDIEKLLVADAASVTAINLTGNELANEITGNAGANVIDGGLGADAMTGLGGNDLYIVDDAGDVTVEGAGGGLDTVFTSVTRTLGAELERIGVNGFATTFAIDLTGNGVANEMWGNDGANILDGAGGADIMRGFAGDDTYRVDNAGDVVIELLNQGTDTVTTTVSYTIAHDIEKLLVSDAASVTSLNLTGNDSANEITGNAGANTIDGGLGADTMTGLGGNDLYYVDNVGDVIVEAANEGLDTVFTTVSTTLGSEVERLGVNGFGTTFAIDLTGNALDNEMWGNAGANMLDGKAGSDIIYGFAGADTFAFTTALGASNIDQLVDFTAAIDKIALDDAIFTGLATGTLAAGAFRTGSAAADADDRIIYDATTGALYFDADGDGSGAAIQFATVHEGLSLTASDFTVI